MEMTDYEIARSYRESRDKEEQIRILADLNLVEPEEIRRKLTAGGLRIPKARKWARCTDVDYTRVRRLYQAGHSDAEIARQVGCAPSTVQTWRNRNGLPMPEGVDQRFRANKAAHG